MSDWPISVVEPLPTIHPWSMESIGDDILNSMTVAGMQASLYYAQSAVYPAANLALFVPFFLSKPIAVTKMFTYNGTAAVHGNIGIGIYDIAGTKIVSMGATAQAGVDQIQTFDIADTQIGPGVFYMAMVEDDATSTFYRVDISEGAIRPRIMGMAQMAAAMPLPATAVFAALTTNYVPVFGLLVAPRILI